MTSKELQDSINAFLQAGGKIKTYQSHADEIAAKHIPRNKYFKYRQSILLTANQVQKLLKKRKK